MPRPDEDAKCLPSLLDRLTECSLYGASSRPWYGISQTMEAVQRDLENLLNTRQTHQGLCEQLPEVQRSLITYGVPDLSMLDASSPHHRTQLARMLEASIRHFEPRLKEVRVEPVEVERGGERSLHFRISGRLSIEPAAYVTFDTTLQLSSGQYSVTQAS